MAQKLEKILEKAQSEKQGHLEFIAQLVDEQLNGFKTRSLERRLKKANFPII